jgi:polysaccharide export outer membrane protein
MNIRLVSVILSALFVLGSCASTKDIVYFQNRLVNQPETIDKHAGIVIQPKDMVSIVVSSKNPELAAMFNLPVISYQAGSEISQLASYNQRLMGYVVSDAGTIDFPVLGELKVVGMTRWELAEFIKKKLVDGGYLSEAVVTVEFINFKISVMGEVSSPGTFVIEGDKVTVLQALALARDLTIFGRRDNVSVIREKDGQRVIYEINLTDVDLFKSPAYYLQQNDVVYVQPNDIKARQSTTDDKTLRISSIALSSGSLLVSMVTLLATLGVFTN